MDKWKIKKGDRVVVIAGKSRGVVGDVLRVLREDRKVVVSGVNVATISRKPTTSQPGGQVKEEKPIHVSNVMIVDPDFGKPARIGFKFDENGKKVRYSKLSGSVLQ